MENIELVKFAQLDLLNELDRLCNKYGIQYFLAGGTLIGAVRHNGFIPWDDDIDVGMMRNQYEKFVSACVCELDKEYEFVDWNVDKNSPHPFGKLKIKGTHYKEKLATETDIDDGIFIDIFPYDNAPDNVWKRRMQSLSRLFYKKALLLKCGFTIDSGSTFPKSILYSILRKIVRNISVNRLKEGYAQLQRKYNGEKTENVICFGGSYSYERELVRGDYFDSFIQHRFEKMMYPIPKLYDKYLSSVYGDYMKLPPVEQRVSKHGIEYIDLGGYNIRYKGEII